MTSKEKLMYYMNKFNQYNNQIITLKGKLGTNSIIVVIINSLEKINRLPANLSYVCSPVNTNLITLLMELLLKKIFLIILIKSITYTKTLMESKKLIPTPKNKLIILVMDSIKNNNLITLVMDSIENYLIENKREIIIIII